jgi:hypothetical protein
VTDENVSDEVTCQRLREAGAVERYVAEMLSPDELELFESHMIECPRCQQDVKLAAAVRGALAPVGSRSRVLRLAAGIALAAAAALAIVLVTPELRQELGFDGHRGVSAVSELRPIAPRGPIAALDLVRWYALAGSERYRVRVFDQEGRIVWEGETTDTILRVPELGDLQTDTPYYWRLEARVGWDRWVSSELVGFQLQPIGEADPVLQEDPGSRP